MARAVAGYDYDKARAIGFWPVLELLESFDALARERALDEYRHATLVWTTKFPSVWAKKPPKPPELPPILRKRDG